MLFLISRPLLRLDVASGDGGDSSRRYLVAGWPMQKKKNVFHDSAYANWQSVASRTVSQKLNPCDKDAA